MKHFLFIATFIVITVGLNGCGNNDDDNSNTTDTTTPTTTTTPANSLSEIAANGTDAIDLTDSAPLTANITTLFGEANAEPVAVADNETLSSVINSAQARDF